MTGLSYSYLAKVREPLVPAAREAILFGTLVQEALTDDLRHEKYRGDDPLRGHCYVASEALYHLLGGKEAGYTPTFVRHEGEPHWYLRHRSGFVVDVTAGQFQTPVPYDLGLGRGFLTGQPSKRAQIVIDRVNGLG